MDIDPQRYATDAKYRAMVVLMAEHPELTRAHALHVIEHGWSGAYLTLASALRQLVEAVIR
jgi:hypothetical protein